MKNSVTTLHRTGSPATATPQPDSEGHVEQLTLLDVPTDTRAAQLPTSAVHRRFQLSRTTRERGLQHVAEIRRRLAESQEKSGNDNVRRLPPRTTRAA